MRIVAATLALALILGCKDSTEPAVINGTYTLQTVRDDPLPAVVIDGIDYAYKVTAGSITLNGDLTFSDSRSYWQYVAGNVTTGTVACTGQWEPTSERTFTLSETSVGLCGVTGTGEWDGRNRVTVAWYDIGTAGYGR